MKRNRVLEVVLAAAVVLVSGCIWQISHSSGEVNSYNIEAIASGAQTKINEEKKCVRQLFSMDTIMTFTAFGEQGEEAVQACVDEVNRLDALLSTGIETSEISQVNEKGTLSLSEDTRVILERAMDIYDRTDGLFDFTIYPLMHLWGFPTQEYHVATEEEIARILPYVNAGEVSLEGDVVTLAEGQQMDLGAIAKGYTSARLVEIMREHGVTSGMVNLGGNVQTLGTKPDGNRWNIGIQDPIKNTGEILLIISTADEAIITSGGYERFFEQDGRRYIHIVDPKTGYPVENDLSSVTIVSPDGTLADALSTSLFLMGKEKAEEFWRQYKDEFQLILIDNEENVSISKGLEEYVRYDGKYEVIE